MSLRILLVDDHEIMRQGLRALLEREHFHVVGEASNGRVAIQHAEKLRPDIAVVDLGMPELNGLDAAQQIVRASPTTRAIALTMHAEDSYVVAALRAGIKGYVLKSQVGADLVQAIQDVSRGLTYLSPVVSAAVVEAFLGKRPETAGDRLSLREREVLQLVAEGRTTKEVAQILNVSAKTADSHRTHIMRKLDIHETAGLVRYAIREGVIQA
jgi:two-component system, NarL family, response regulator NreC